MENKKSKRADLERHHLKGFLMGLVVASSLVYTALEYSTGGDLIDLPTKMDLSKLHRDTTMMVAIDREDNATAQKPDRRQEGKDRLNVKVAQLDRLDAATKGVEQAPETDARQGGEEVLDDVVPVEKPSAERPELMPPLPLAIKEPPPVPVSEPLDKKSLHVLTDNPTPPGGWVAFMKWITKALVYPKQAAAQKQEGVVSMTFMVERDGSVTHIRVKTSAGKLFDEEATRVMGLMGKWKPALERGKPCRCMVEMPVVFKL